MDNQSYEQVFLSEEQVGDAKNFLLDNIEVRSSSSRTGPGDQPAHFIDVTVTKRSLGKGTRFRGTPTVTVQTGYVVQVPLHRGREKIRIDTRTGSTDPVKG